MASRFLSAEAEAAFRKEKQEEQERLAEALNNGSLSMSFWEFLGLLAICVVVISAFFGGLHLASFH